VPNGLKNLRRRPLLRADRICSRLLLSNLDFLAGSEGRGALIAAVPVFYFLIYTFPPRECGEDDVDLRTVTLRDGRCLATP
jgi:hypothetical protein